jgi:hypothetical protein
MAVAQDRKKVVLAICLCLFAISATYRLLNPYQQERVARLTYSGGSSRASKPEPGANSRAPEKEDREVWIEPLLNPPIHSARVHKNIFQKQKPPGPGPDLSEEPVAVQTAAGASPEIDKRQQVQEDLSKFKSFGYMQGQGDKLLFLERGKDIFLIREGDRIDGKYLVKSITEKQLIIRAESIGEDVRIDLGKF